MALILISYFAACVALAVRVSRTSVLEERSVAAARGHSPAVAAAPTNPFTVGTWAVLMFCFPVVFVALLIDRMSNPGAKRAMAGPK